MVLGLSDFFGGRIVAWRRWLFTWNTPIPRQMIAGHEVRKQNPGPMGSGFGSGHRPMSASRIILINGPHPIRTSQNPILNQRLPKYFFTLEAY